MKTGVPSFRAVLASTLSALLVLAVVVYGQRASPPPAPTEPLDTPRHPGPHSTVILDTTPTGQTDYQDPSGDQETLDITLPALDRDYQYPHGSGRYRSINRTVGQDTPPAGPAGTPAHNVVVIRMTPPPPGTAAGDLVKQTPLVIVQTGQDPVPTPMTTARPTVILNLRGYFPAPASGKPASVPVTPDP